MDVIEVAALTVILIFAVVLVLPVVGTIAVLAWIMLVDLWRDLR